MKHIMFFFLLFFCLVVSSQDNNVFFDWKFENASELTNAPSAGIFAETEAVRDSSEMTPIFLIFLTHENGGELKIGLFDEDQQAVYPLYKGGNIEVNIKFRDENGNFTGPEDFETLSFVSKINRFFEGSAIEFNFYKEDYSAGTFLAIIDKFSCHSSSLKKDCSNLYIQTVYKGESKVFRVPTKGFKDALAYLKNWYKDTIDPFQENKKPLGG